MTWKTLALHKHYWYGFPGSSLTYVIWLQKAHLWEYNVLVFLCPVLPAQLHVTDAKYEKKADVCECVLWGGMCMVCVCDVSDLSVEYVSQEIETT